MEKMDRQRPCKDAHRDLVSPNTAVVTGSWSLDVTGSYIQSQMCGRGRLELGVPQRGFVQSKMGTSPPRKINHLNISPKCLPDIPGVYDPVCSELPQNMGRPEKRVCFIVWEINDFNN